MKLLTTIAKNVGVFSHYTRLRAQDRKAGARLTLVQDNLERISAGDILLFTRVHNDQYRIPFFVDYYRKLGVRHFIIVDIGSTDGFRDWASGQEIISVYSTVTNDASARSLWTNDLLRQHGVSHWCLVVAPSEFLIYPHMATRSLRALAAYLSEERRHCMHAIALDAYSRCEHAVLEIGADPFTVCPLFDRDGYVQSLASDRTTIIRGGPHLRVRFRDRPSDAPRLNRMPFVKWQSDFHFLSDHSARPLRLNRAHQPKRVSTTGALFRFELTLSRPSARLREPPYLEAMPSKFYAPGISVHYSDPTQLVDLGLMTIGRWF